MFRVERTGFLAPALRTKVTRPLRGQCPTVCSQDEPHPPTTSSDDPLPCRQRSRSYMEGQMQTITLPARIAAAVKNAKLPANYLKAKSALAKCVSIDECLDWADKATALASYARQTEDVELENYCRRIKARAARRAGELMLELDARGAHMKKEG